MSDRPADLAQQAWDRARELREFADALDKDRGHGKSYVTLVMRESATALVALASVVETQAQPEPGVASVEAPCEGVTSDELWVPFEQTIREALVRCPAHATVRDGCPACVAIALANNALDALVALTRSAPQGATPKMSQDSVTCCAAARRETDTREARQYVGAAQTYIRQAQAIPPDDPQHGHEVATAASYLDLAFAALAAVSAEEGAAELKADDLLIETWIEGRGSGVLMGGGYSAPYGVKITHKPTGLVVTCDSEKSQLRNKALALDLLRERLAGRVGGDGR